MDTLEIIEAIEDTQNPANNDHRPVNNDHGQKTLAKILDLPDTLFKAKFRMAKRTFMLLNNEVIIIIY